jgi:hypothetical protein
MNLVADSRRDRKKKLSSKLKLPYPTSEELDKISRLAGVKYPFGSHINSIILDAHLLNASFGEVSAPKVRQVLKLVASQARPEF